MVAVRAWEEAMEEAKNRRRKKAEWKAMADNGEGRWEENLNKKEKVQRKVVDDTHSFV